MMIIVISLVFFISSYAAECKEPPNRVNFVVIKSTPTKTYLKWNKPANNGSLLRYEVIYKSIEELYPMYSIQTVANGLVIDSLSPSTSYVICLSAINEVGQGPPTCRTVQTKDINS